MTLSENATKWVQIGVITLLLAVVIYFLISYLNGSKHKSESFNHHPESFSNPSGFENGSSNYDYTAPPSNAMGTGYVAGGSAVMSSPVDDEQQLRSNPNIAVQPMGGNEVFRSLDSNFSGAGSAAGYGNNNLPKDCYPKDQLTPQELLPTDVNSVWSQQNPVQGDLASKNFLEAGYHIGINTSGQSLRNPNYQLRSEPQNPTNVVSPWGMTTITPDLSRRPLEIGN